MILKFPLELDQLQAAVDHLLEIARRWAPGLVAVSDNPPPQPSGDVRRPAVAFQATESDVPVYILAPRSLESEALSRNVESVAQQGANLRVVHDPSEIQRDAQMPPLLLNWGGSEALPADLVALNRPDAVRIASDQVDSTLLLEAAVDVKTVSERLGTIPFRPPSSSTATSRRRCGPMRRHDSDRCLIPLVLRSPR